MKSIIKVNCILGTLLGGYLLLSAIHGFVDPKMKMPIYVTIGYLLSQIVFVAVWAVIAIKNKRSKGGDAKKIDIKLRQPTPCTVIPATIDHPTIKSMMLAVISGLVFIVGCDFRAPVVKDYDEALASYEAALKDVELADAGNSNLYHEAVRKLNVAWSNTYYLQCARESLWQDLPHAKKLWQDVENLKIKLFADGKLRYRECGFHYSHACLDHYRREQLSKYVDVDDARICAKFLLLQATVEPEPALVGIHAFEVENKIGEGQLKEAYQILKSIPAEKFTDADSQLMEKIEAKFKEAVDWQNSQLYTTVGEGIVQYHRFMNESSSLHSDRLTSIQWKNKTYDWMLKWINVKLSFKATIVNVCRDVCVTEFGSINHSRKIKDETKSVVLYVRTGDNISFTCHSGLISIQAPEKLKVGQEICILGRYDALNSEMISSKGSGSVLRDAVIIDISLFDGAMKNIEGL